MNFDKYKKTRRHGADRRWTLLFIGDHGNVITIKRFKAIIAAVSCLFLLAFVSLAALFLSHQKTLRTHNDLQKRFQFAQQQIESLRHEKEILMARLVVAESKAKEKVVESQPSTESPAVANSVDSEFRAVAKSKPVSAPPEKSPAFQMRRPQPAENQTPATEAVMRVAVENFKVSREADNANVRAQFKIKNTSLGSQRAAGKAVVILKNADLKRSQWLVMPSVDFSGDKPSGKRGKRFSIKRFRTMNFASKAPDHADQFQTAVVYVFSTTGELLLEQDFAISLPPLPVASSQPQIEQITSREAKPAATPARQPPPQETPAAASTPGEDVLETLENAPSVF
jgi:hypothetical protein